MRRSLSVVLFCLCLIRRFECEDSVNSVCDADSDVEKSCRQKVDVELDRKPKKPFPGCRRFSRTDFDPDSPTIIYLESRGRLGNQIYTYGLLAQMALETGTSPYLNGRTKLLLKNAFTPDSIKIPILEETYCNTKDIPFESFHGNLLDFLNDTSYHKGRFIWLWPPNPNGKTYGGYWPSDYGLDDETLRFMHRMEETVRQTFRFHPHIQAAADATIFDVSKHVKKTDPKSEINFVGIHNRRTDHLEFMQKTEKIKPIKPKYFRDAMDYYRDEYENVAFLYVSDDMEWGRKNLKNKHGDLFFVGRGTKVDANGPEDNWENEDVAIDLAVLGSCNHTIMSRGTYSIFASVFANGETYTFDTGPNLPKRLLIVE